jgi:hypothetical protein
MGIDRFSGVETELRATLIRWVCGCFALAGVACFVVRGPMKMMARSNDFAAIYTSCRALLLGRDPYDHAVLPQVWTESGGAVDRTPTRKLSPAVYPVSTFVMGWPIAVLPARWAQLAWFGLNLACMALLLETLRRQMGLSWREDRMLLLVGFGVGSRAFASCISVGQLSIVVTELGAIAILLASRSTRWIGGLLFGAAIAIKAPLAVVFAAPDLLARRWKPLGVAALLILLLTAIGFLKLSDPKTALSHWRENLKSGSTSGGVNDPSPANPTRIQIISLQYPLSSTISNPVVVRAMICLAGFLLAAPAVYALGKKPANTAVLLPLACLCLVDLSVLYHRTYDATLLVFPLAWALLPSTPRWQAWPALALLLIFILPGTGLPSHDGPASSSLMECLIRPRDAWAVLLLAAWLALCQCVSIKRDQHGGSNSSVFRPASVASEAL